jgi:hypothetical protein
MVTGVPEELEENELEADRASKGFYPVPHELRAQASRDGLGFTAAHVVRTQESELGYPEVVVWMLWGGGGIGERVSAFMSVIVSPISEQCFVRRDDQLQLCESGAELVAAHLALAWYRRPARFEVTKDGACVDLRA